MKNHEKPGKNYLPLQFFVVLVHLSNIVPQFLQWALNSLVLFSSDPLNQVYKIFGWEHEEVHQIQFHRCKKMCKKKNSEIDVYFAVKWMSIFSNSWITPVCDIISSKPKKIYEWVFLRGKSSKRTEFSSFSFGIYFSLVLPKGCPSPSNNFNKSSTLIYPVPFGSTSFHFSWKIWNCFRFRTTKKVE